MINKIGKAKANAKSFTKYATKINPKAFKIVKSEFV